MQKITTFLTFNDQADQAARFYTSIFKHSRITSTSMGPGGTVMSVSFELAGEEYIALNGGPSFSFTSGFSLMVSCDDQAEVDELWAKLTDGGVEEPCGWLKDKFGVSWQIIPKGFGQLLSGGGDPARSQRVVQAMLQMKKIELAGLQRAYDGK